jgi:hypothetical protein
MIVGLLGLGKMEIAHAGAWGLKSRHWGLFGY